MRALLFRAVGIGQAFACSGVPYVKRSSRTADAAPGHPVYAEGVRRWFYFGQVEVCHVSK